MSVVSLGLPERSWWRIELPLRATLALWWLAVKRSGGPLLLVAVAACMGWLLWDGRLPGVVLWVRNVQRMAFSVAIVGPLVTAFACWAAGQNRRRGLNDLLDSTSLPGAYATAAATAGVIFWGLGVFLGCAGVVMLWTATRATWGGPDLRLIAVASGAIVVCALIGALAGRLSANRVLPALMALGGVTFIVAPMGLGYQSIEMLSPLAVIYELTKVWFYKVDDALVGAHLRWLAALGATLAVAVVFWPVRDWLPRGLIAVGATLTVITATPLVGWQAPQFTPGAQALLTYAPTCVTTTVTVCVHPAYESLLDEAAPLVEEFVQPIAGLEGVPTRFEQRVGLVASESGYGERFPLDDGASLFFQIPHTLATELVVWPQPGLPVGSGDAQYVVADWLVQRVSVGHPGSAPLGMFDLTPAVNRMYICDENGCTPDATLYQTQRQEFDAAMARFAALDPVARRAWLEANWTELRAGRLSVEDLP